MDKISVLVTMDVEPVKQVARWTGPETAEQSQSEIQAYVELAGRFGFPVSFFIHPEAAALHSELFLEYQKQGACLGLHLHPMKYHYPKYNYEYGYYSADQQKELISSCKAEWTDALGQAPLYFRPGAFSANDYSFQVLCDLGFRGGSLSVPQRIWPQRYCIWSGAERYPHRANAVFRQVAGSLELANIPLSVDLQTPVARPGFTFCQDLRPSTRGVDRKKVLDNIVRQIAADKPAVPVIHIVDHNDQKFPDPAGESRRNLLEVLENIGPCCEKYGYQVMGSTVEKICDAVFAQPQTEPVGWLLDNSIK